MFPSEIHIAILPHLHSLDLYTLGQVNHYFHSLIPSFKNDHLKVRLYLQQFSRNDPDHIIWVDDALIDE